MTIADWLLLVVALPGHLALWILANNYVHALPIGFRALKIYSALLHSVMALLPVVALGMAVGQPGAVAPYSAWDQLAAGAQLYFLVCWAMALGPLPWWTWLRFRQQPPAELIETHSESVDLERVLGERPIGRHGVRAWFLSLPGNEVFKLEETEKTVCLPRLAADLDGFSIAHISDLHFEGTIGPAFFREVVDRVNRLEADVIAVTGDVFDRPECLDWIPETLAKLRAPLGVHFILGNHDLRLGQPSRARHALEDIGWNNLGGRWQTTRWRDREVLLAGNELPWIGPAADLSNVPDHGTGAPPLRVLLAHTPDQYPWARRHDFDLMLAGHCHGGQIRFPVIGPIVSPSRRGAFYACGTFYESPTLMHVSRGVSSMQTLRYNCPPEITRLVLRSGVRTGSESERPAAATDEALVAAR